MNLAQEYSYTDIETLLIDEGATANKVVVRDTDKKRANAFHQEGQKAHSAGNYKKARRLYLKTLDTNPFNYGAYSNIALLDMNDGQYKSCLDNSRKALEFNPEYSHAIYTTWQCAYLANKPKKEYMSYVRHYIRLNPNNFRTKELFQRFPELKKN